MTDARHDYFCAALTGLCQGAYVMTGVGMTAKVLGDSGSAALWAPAVLVEFANEIADAALAAEMERRKGGENLLEDES